MTEGILAEWTVEPGARFKEGDTLYVVETEKVANEIVAERDGVLVNALVSVGETVPCGAPVGYWVAAGEPAGEPAVAPSVPDPDGHRVVASPHARLIAKQRGIDLKRVHGTGTRGRIVASDVQAAADLAKGAEAVLTTAQVSETVPRGGGRDRLIRTTNMQATTARRLTASKQETPHFYLALEAQVARVMALRADLNESGAGLRVTLNHFILAAVARALREMPEANRVWTHEGIVEYGTVDVGVAVDTPRGLVAPVLRDAASRRFMDLAQHVDALVERARAGSLAVEDFEGGSLTVSNAGMHNVTYMTSIINPGQSMILGVGSIRDVFRPDGVGRPRATRELGLVLSVDHRVTDGVSALRFLNLVVDLLQRPARLLLD